MAGVLTVILAGSCFGHPFFKVAAGPIPITSDRLLFAVVALQYLIYRRWGLAEPKPIVAADYILLAFVGFLGISTVLHDWTYHGSLPMAQYLFLYLMPCGLYWIVRQSRLTERAILGTFTVCGLFALYLCLTAIAESRQMWSLVFPTYLRLSSFEEFFGRGRGPFLNPTTNGFYIGVCICVH